MGLEALNSISDLSLPVFAFYLIVFCNVTKELMSCRLQHFFDTNMYAKHFIGVLLLFFLVIMIDPDNMEKNLLVNVGLTLLIYVIFIITSRLSFVFIVIVLILLLVCYIIGTIAKKKQKEKKEEEYKQLKLIENIIFIIVSVISAIGFIIYAVEKYREYGKEFSLLKFIIGTPVCRNHTPASAKII